MRPLAPARAAAVSQRCHCIIFDVHQSCLLCARAQERPVPTTTSDIVRNFVQRSTLEYQHKVVVFKVGFMQIGVCYAATYLSYIKRLNV